MRNGRGRRRAGDNIDDDLADLIAMAEKLAGQPKRDPKLKKLLEQLDSLVADGFSPIVFCRYISTAEWVAEAVGNAFRRRRSM